MSIILYAVKLGISTKGGKQVAKVGGGGLGAYSPGSLEISFLMHSGGGFWTDLVASYLILLQTPRTTYVAIIL